MEIRNPLIWIYRASHRRVSKRERERDALRLNAVRSLVRGSWRTPSNGGIVSLDLDSLLSFVINSSSLVSPSWLDWKETITTRNQTQR